MENKRRTDGDETMYEVHPIALCLSPEWMHEEVLCGTLHSRFEKVQNYIFIINGERRMLTIMREGNTLLPDSIILSNEDFDNLKNQREFHLTKRQKAHCSKPSSCSLMELSLDKFTTRQFEQRIQLIDNFSRNSEKKSDLTRLPDKFTDHLNSFIEGMMSKDAKAVETAFQGLVGAGRGLTPAADDALIGALAGSLLGFTLAMEKDRYLVCVKPILFHLCNEKLTTEISCKYLKCACRGDFSQNLCKLIRTLTGEETEDIPTLLERIAKTGHTSGMDMLYGLQETLQYIWENWKGGRYERENLSIGK